MQNGGKAKSQETIDYVKRIDEFLKNDAYRPANTGKGIDLASILREEDTAIPARSYDDFLAHNHRSARFNEDGSAIFEEGSAYPFQSIRDFYEQHVVPTSPKDGTRMPDVLFQIGTLNRNISNQLAMFLPDFTDGLSEVRISGRAIKHIYDSRGVAEAPATLQRLQQAILQAKEILPDYKKNNRALLILNDVPSSSPKAKHGVTVVEVAATSKGLDVVTSFIAPYSYLKKARNKAEEIKVSRTEVRRSPHPDLSNPVHDQTQPAADFPGLARDNLNTTPEPFNTSTVNTNEASMGGGANIDHQALMQLVRDNPDQMIAIKRTMDDGSEVETQITLKELIENLEAERIQADKDNLAAQVAISCRLRNGE